MYNRDGEINALDDTGEDAWATTHGAFIVTMALSGTDSNAVDGLSAIVLTRPLSASAAFRWRLAMSSNTAQEVVFLLASGQQEPQGLPHLWLDAPWFSNATTIILYPVALYPRGHPQHTNYLHDLTVELLSPDGATILAQDRLQVNTAPLIIPWEGAQLVDVFATEEMLSVSNAIQAIPQLRYVTATNDARWAQDFVKFAQVQTEAASSSCWLVDLIHSRAGDFVQTLLGQPGTDLRPVQWNVGGDGGNIMISPPVPGYPFGRPVIGSKCPAAEAYLQANGVQTDPLVVSNDWLLVGHIDEVIAFVDTNKVLIADPWSAASLMHAAITNGQGMTQTILCSTTDTKADAVRSFQAICVATNDTGQWKMTTLAEELGGSTNQTSAVIEIPLFSPGDVLRIDDELLLVSATNGALCTVIRGLGQSNVSGHQSNACVYALTSLLIGNLVVGTNDSPSAASDVAFCLASLQNAFGTNMFHFSAAPVLFEYAFRHEGSSPSEGFLAATANMANGLLLAPGSYVAPDPGSQVFRDAILDPLPATVFLDVWDTYHVGEGELHCGTAARRLLVLPSPWWLQIPNWR